MIHPTPTQVLLTTTFEPLVRQLSGALARGVRLIDHFIQNDLTPLSIAVEISSKSPDENSPDF